MKARVLGWRLFAAAAVLLVLSTASVAIAPANITNPVKKVLCAIWTSLMYIGVVAAGVVVVISGVNYLYNRDNPAKRNASISWIIHALIGLIILSVAKSIVEGIGFIIVCVK